jgi:hypothetical protein
MLSSTTTALPHPQWRLMNHLHRAGPESAEDALCPLGIDDCELVELARRSLVRASTPDGAEVDLELLSLDRKFVKLLQRFNIQVGLTPAGVDWVTGNPYNRALLAVAELDRGRGALVRDAIAKAAVDAAVFLLLDGVRLIEVRTCDGDKVDVTSTRALTPGVLKDLRVHLTAKGRGVLG